MTSEALIKRLFVTTALFGAVIVGASFAVFESPIFGWSALAGLILGVVNFWLLKRVVSDMVEGRRQGGMTVVYFVKLGALFGILFSLIYFAGLDPVGLAAGFTALVLAIVVVGVTAASQERPEGAADAEVSMESLDG